METKMETGIFQGIQGSSLGINNTEFITELESCIIRWKGSIKNKTWRGTHEITSTESEKA
jgi:hypothetical protein